MKMTRSLGQAGSAELSDLLGLLDEQCALYGRLTGLSDEQRALISGDQPEQLLELLGRRQQIIDRLGQLNERMRPFQEDWQAVRARLSEGDARRVDDLVCRVNASLASILERDKADAELLARRRGETAAQANQLKCVRAAGAAYAASQQLAPAAQVEWTGE